MIALCIAAIIILTNITISIASIESIIKEIKEDEKNF